MKGKKTITSFLLLFYRPCHKNNSFLRRIIVNNHHQQKKKDSIWIFVNSFLFLHKWFYSCLIIYIVYFIVYFLQKKVIIKTKFQFQIDNKTNDNYKFSKFLLTFNKNSIDNDFDCCFLHSIRIKNPIFIRFEYIHKFDLRIFVYNKKVCANRIINFQNNKKKFPKFFTYIISEKVYESFFSKIFGKKFINYYLIIWL